MARKLGGRYDSRTAQYGFNVTAPRMARKSSVTLTFGTGHVPLQCDRATNGAEIWSFEHRQVDYAGASM